MELSDILIVVLIALIFSSITVSTFSFFLYSKQKKRLSEIIKFKLEDERNKKAIEALLSESNNSSKILRVKGIVRNTNDHQKKYSTCMNYKQYLGEYWIPELEVKKAK